METQPALYFCLPVAWWFRIGLFSCSPLNFLVVSPCINEGFFDVLQADLFKCLWILKRCGSSSEQRASVSSSNTCRTVVHEILWSTWRHRFGTEARFQISVMLTTCLVTLYYEETKISWNLSEKEEICTPDIVWNCRKRELLRSCLIFEGLDQVHLCEIVRGTFFHGKIPKVLVFIGCFP